MIFTYNYNIYVFSYVWITVFRYDFKDDQHHWKNGGDCEIFTPTPTSLHRTMEEAKWQIKLWLKEKKCKHSPRNIGKWTICSKCGKTLFYNDK